MTKLNLLDKIKENLLNIPNIQAKKIIVFGSAQAGISTLFACKKLGLMPSYIVDNNQTKWGQKIFEWEVHSPENLSKENKDQLIILVASQYYGHISSQLEKMGFSECVHYFFVFRANVNKERNCKEVNGIKIGKYTFGYEQHCFPGSTVKSIGSFCSINQTAQFVFNHPTDFISTHTFQYCNGCIGEKVPPITGFPIIGVANIVGAHSIVVGNDVWIGANTVILPHVRLGNGAIISVGSVVSKDVPDYAIVGGVPARVIRYRFTEEQIEILNRIKWWDWDDGKITENAKYFTDMEAFFDKFGK